MTVTAEQITKAKAHGLTNVEALAAACDKHNLRFYLACAILQKETGGRNIYGHDRGGVFTYPDGRNIEVTEANFAEFWERVRAGATSNGVGPMQITYRGHFPLMAAAGLRPWVPAENIDYGVGLIAADYRKRRNLGDGVIDSFHYAATVYNLGKWSPTWPYGRDAVAKAEVWKTRVGTDDLDTASTPTRQEPTVPKPNHSTKWNADYVWWRGGYVTVQDAEILETIAAEVEPWWGRLELTQGGLSRSVPESANTHVGLGAFDVRTKGRRADGKLRTQADAWRLTSVFLRSGLPFFPRGFVSADSFQGRTTSNDQDGNEHGHVVSRESIDHLHPDARAQLTNRFYGFLRPILGKRGAGLAGAPWRRYDGPATPLERWATSPYNPANIAPDTGLYKVNADTLLGLNVDRQPIKERDRDFPVVAAKRVHRWGRWNVVTAAGTYYSLDYLTPSQPTQETP